MSSLQYHALWMGLALVLLAAASALLASRSRVRETRREHAESSLDVLAHYSEWLAAQRRAAAFQSDGGQGLALSRLRALQEESFPDLRDGIDLLAQLHARALKFLVQQDGLRGRDPEAWLESDHDRRYMALWSEHREVVHSLAGCLRERAGRLLVDAEPESVFPA